MAEENKPAWVELSSTDPAASRAFYSKLFGWRIDVNPDPQYGGYALAYTGDAGVGGIGPKQPGDPSPSMWSIYIGTKNADETAKKVTAAGGKVVAPPFDVPGQGRMTVFQDPSGAFISAWQGQAMSGFVAGGEHQFGWAELNARGIDKALAFYKSVFGWDAKESTAGGADAPPYTEFQLGGESLAGAMEMNSMVPKEVPSRARWSRPRTSRAAGSRSSRIRRARPLACSRCAERATPRGSPTGWAPGSRASRAPSPRRGATRPHSPPGRTSRGVRAQRVGRPPRGR